MDKLTVNLKDLIGWEKIIDSLKNLIVEQC